MKRALYIIDPGLKSLTGHYFEYDRAIASEALNSGINVIVLCNKEASIQHGFKGMTVARIFSDDIWSSESHADYNNDSDTIKAGTRFATECRSFFSSNTAPCPQDAVLFPNIAKPHLFGLSLLIKSDMLSNAKLWAILRYPTSFFEGLLSHSTIDFLRNATQANRITLCTDSHRLADEWARRHRLPLKVLPIPHGSTQIEHTINKEDDSLTFSMLGNAREEKGFSSFVSAITASRSHTWGLKFRFIIQTNDPDAEAKNTLRKSDIFEDPRVKIIDKALDSISYAATINESDVIVIPYSSSVYSARTSGIFLEAALAGKVLICTDDTWMADNARAFGIGIIIQSNSANAILDGLVSAKNSYRALKTSASHASEKIRNFHNPKNFLDILMSNPISCQGPSFEKQRNAVIFYPWGDATEGTSGASRRLKLLVFFLEQHYSNVRVVFTAESQTGGQIGSRSTAIPIEYMKRGRVRLIRQLSSAIGWLLNGSQSQIYHTWYHIWPRFGKYFEKFATPHVKWATDIFVEYSYFVPTLQAIAEKQGKMITVTHLDVLHNQDPKSCILRHFLKFLEIDALSKVGRFYCVSKNDRDLFRRERLSCREIPLPVSFSASDELPLPRPDRYLPARPVVCLFVGSEHAPNKDAASFIISLASDFRRRGIKLVKFYIVGDCCPPLRTPNLKAFGKISEDELKKHYEDAGIVLVPLSAGTGVSMKVVEALAHGVPVLATPIGARGLQLKSETDLLIRSLSDFGDAIIDLVHSPKKRLALAHNGRKSVSRLDYRRIFHIYLPKL